MKDLVGQKFGRLKIIQRMDNDKWRNLYWLCRCDCGDKIVIRGSSLINGNTKSCGCLRKEIIHGHNKKGKTSRTYISWANMIQRCINLNNKAYHNYGGRGITVCKRWGKFENFLKDMGESPSKNHSIDRIDNNGNYCKSNCRWASRKQQNRNKRDNHLETYNGKTQCLMIWAEEYQISYRNLHNRIYKLGWSIKKALTTFTKKYRKRKE